MLKFCDRHKGAISVFLTLILLPTFIFGGVIVDGSRVLGAKNIVSGAGDLAMNAALSNYYDELNQTYGLLAMAETPEEVESVMKDFFETTLNAVGVTKEDFNKALIYLELTDDFSAVSVAGSEIYETEVIRQEVLEYMKYRAPVTLVDRALDDRIGAFKNIHKEKKAADSQIKFESEMDDVQALFDEIKELTDRQEELYELVKDENGLNRMVDHADDSYDDITWLSVAYKRMTSCYDSIEGDTEGLMEQMCDNTCDVNDITEEKAAKIITMIRIKNGMSGKNPNDILKDVDKDSDEYQEKLSLIADYESALENMEEGISNTEKQLDALVEYEYKNFSAQRVWAVEGEKNCIELVGEDGTGGLVKKLEDKFKKLQDEYEAWNSAVADLPEDSESKPGYEANLSDVDDFFKKDGGIAEFKRKITDNKTFYNEVYTQLDKVTFTGKRLDEEIDDKGDFIGSAPTDAVNSQGEITAKGKTFKDTYYVDTEIVLSVENTDPEGDEFVKLLKDKYCKESDNADEAKANEYANKTENDLDNCLEDLEELFTSSDVLEGEERPNIDSMGGGDLPSNWLGYRTATNVGAEVENNMQPQLENNGLKDKDARKKTSQNGSKNLNADNENINAMSTIPDLLAKVGVEIAEPLYLTEYVMGMFSYYTCDKDREGNSIEPESLNGKSLKDNAAYRAEVEYILWGDPNVRDNVGMTKAIIFAANLVFNISFAFTDRILREDARMVASFFPVPPIAQTAIKCAFQVMVGTIETIKNLVDICEGKAVPLVKAKGYRWKTPIIRAHTGKDGDGGFTYEDYLWILVTVGMFVPSSQDQMLARTADCIELNMTDKKSNNDNTLKDKFTMVQVEASVSIDTFFLDKLSGAGYDVQEVNEETFKIPYTGIQGY